ncbi:MAG: helix-turn-helix domain-containing protein [Oscillospiraceae bacterium]
MGQRAKAAQMEGRHEQRKKEYYTTQQGAEQLKAWAADGFSQKEIAAKAGISARTLLRWRQNLPQIAEALRTGEARGDTQVESRRHGQQLYRAAGLQA